MRRMRRKAEPASSIELAPLIDMVFILLIFFMVTTTFVKDMKVDIERPGAVSAARATSKALRVNIDVQGAIYIDGNPVRPWMVQSRVRDLLEAGTSQSVLVIADRRVQVETLVEVVDQCRLAGAADVGVAPEREAGGV